jgi:hypothetical protein
MKNPRLLAKLVEAVRRYVDVVNSSTAGVEDALDRLDESDDLPKIVCLCGSTRFYEEFQKANFRETLRGNIVLSVGFYPHAGVSKEEHGGFVGITPAQKERLDWLHKRKIDLADEVLVLNKGGYVGDSTRSEVQHALATGKPIRWLEAVDHDTV